MADESMIPEQVIETEIASQNVEDPSTSNETSDRSCLEVPQPMEVDGCIASHPATPSIEESVLAASSSKEDARLGHSQAVMDQTDEEYIENTIIVSLS